MPPWAKESVKYESFHQSVIISFSFFNIILRATCWLYSTPFPNKFLASLCNTKTAVDKEISQ